MENYKPLVSCYLLNENILGFDIAMNNVLGVQVGDCLRDLQDVIRSLDLLEQLALLCVRLLEQRALLQVLDDEVVALVVFDETIETENVRVGTILVDDSLLVDLFLHSLVEYLLFIDYFECHHHSAVHVALEVFFFR